MLPWTVQGNDNQVLIHAGELLTDPALEPLQNVTLVVEHSRIRSVESGFLEPTDVGWNDEAVTVLDLSSAFVMPGLIDLHVHLTSPAEPGGDLRVVTLGPADLALMALELGHKNLAAGFTTVLDLGTGRRDHEQAIYALRNAISGGRVQGPRIISAGSPISPTGASRTGSYRSNVSAAIPPQGVCDGADDCRRVVREQIARGADIINVYNSGSLNDDFIAPQTFTDEEFSAIVETAHILGRIVVADGHTAKGINAALRAGADIVDTAPWPDEESWRLMKETGAVFEPHLYAFENAVGDAPESLGEGTMHWIPSPIMRRLYEIKSKPYSAERAYREGIPIVFGSDTGVIPHGDNAGEFAELVRIGLSPAESIATATTNAAKVLKLDQQIGTLEAGKVADIIATHASPLEDVSELERVKFVMRKGVVFRNDIESEY
ncbi:amidohydrolase family protein [Pseudomonadota bacterium]